MNQTTYSIPNISASTGSSEATKKWGVKNQNLIKLCLQLTNFALSLAKVEGRAIIPPAPLLQRALIYHIRNLGIYQLIHKTE